jgi:hypothetical protein
MARKIRNTHTGVPPARTLLCAWSFLLACIQTILAGPGDLDLGFNPSVVGNDNQYVLAAIQPDGEILLGGQFTSVNGTNRNHVARLYADGSLDAAFDPNIGPSSAATVNSMAVQPDGRIVVAGSFKLIGVHLCASVVEMRGTVTTRV